MNKFNAGAREKLFRVCKTSMHVRCIRAARDANTKKSAGEGPALFALLHGLSGLGYFENVRNEGSLKRLLASRPAFLPLFAGTPGFAAPAPLRVATLQSRPGMREGSAGRGAKSFFAEAGGGASKRAMLAMRSILYGLAMQTTAPSECALE
jgi:hypothetical protein